jgi:hypothetical protein
MPPVMQLLKNFPLLWNPKVYYGVHNSPPLSLSWARSNQSIPLHSICLRSILILYTHLHLGLPSCIYIVTCQPIVGLRNRALLGSRPVNNSRLNTRYATIGEAAFSPYRAEPNRTVRCYTTGRDDVTRHHARFRGNTVVNTVTWRNRVDCLRFSFRWFWIYKRSG